MSIKPEMKIFQIFYIIKFIFNILVLYDQFDVWLLEFFLLVLVYLRMIQMMENPLIIQDYFNSIYSFSHILLKNA
jgi:hypothetical protein